MKFLTEQKASQKINFVATFSSVFVDGIFVSLCRKEYGRNDNINLLIAES